VITSPLCGAQTVSAMIAVGARVPAHATTMGAFILAFKLPVRAEHFGGGRWRNSASKRR